MILTQPSWWDFLRVISLSFLTVKYREEKTKPREKKLLLENHTGLVIFYSMLNQSIHVNPTEVKQRVLHVCF